MDIETLTQLLSDAEEHHGQWEASAPKDHWSVWCAAYIVSRQQGRSAAQAVADATAHTETTLGATRGRTRVSDGREPRAGPAPSPSHQERAFPRTTNR